MLISAFTPMLIHPHPEYLWGRLRTSREPPTGQLDSSGTLILLANTLAGLSQSSTV